MADGSRIKTFVERGSGTGTYQGVPGLFVSAHHSPDDTSPKTFFLQRPTASAEPLPSLVRVCWSKSCRVPDTMCVLKRSFPDVVASTFRKLSYIGCLE